MPAAATAPSRARPRVPGDRGTTWTARKRASPAARDCFRLRTITPAFWNDPERRRVRPRPECPDSGAAHGGVDDHQPGGHGRGASGSPAILTQQELYKPGEAAHARTFVLGHRFPRRSSNRCFTILASLSPIASKAIWNVVQTRRLPRLILRYLSAVYPAS